MHRMISCSGVGLALIFFVVSSSLPVAAAEQLRVTTSNTGTYIAAPQFDNAGDFSEGLAAVKVKNNWGFIDKTGKLVIEPQFNPGQAQNGPTFSEGLAAVNFQQGVAIGNALWGFIDKKGNVVINPQFMSDYDSPPSFLEGLARIKVDFKYGFIDKAGRMAITPRFDSAGWFSGGLAVVKIDDKYGYINKIGTLVIKPIYDSAGAFSEGLATVTLNGKSGFIDSAGRLVVKPSLDSIGGFSEGLAPYAVKNFSHSDARGKPITSAPDNKEDSSERWRYGFVDRTGRPVIPAQFPYTTMNIFGSTFKESLAVVQFGLTKSGEIFGDGKFGYIDKTGRIVINPKFDFGSSFSEGLAAIEVNKKHGYIDKAGRMVISPRFDDASDFRDGNARVQLGGKYGFIAR